MTDPTQVPAETLSIRHNQWGDVEVIAPGGRVMFEIVRGKDARSIEVRSVDVCKVRGILYSHMLEIRPVVSNVVRISTVPYDE